MGEKSSKIHPAWPLSSIHHLGDQIVVAWSNAAIRGWNLTSHTRGYVNSTNLEG